MGADFKFEISNFKNFVSASNFRNPLADKKLVLAKADDTANQFSPDPKADPPDPISKFHLHSAVLGLCFRREQKLQGCLLAR